MMKRETGALALAAGLALGTSARAQDIKLQPVIEARLRYEHDDQADLDKDSDALLIRVRAGIEASSGHWSALGQAQGTLAMIGDYYDGLHGAADRPLVYDPQNIGLYRAQL